VEEMRNAGFQVLFSFFIFDRFCPRSAWYKFYWCQGKLGQFFKKRAIRSLRGDSHRGVTTID